MPRETRPYHSSLSAAERSAIARYAATVKHAALSPEERRAATRKASAGLERRWEQEAIALGATTPVEIAKQVDLIRRAHGLRLAAAGRRALAKRRGAA